MKKLLILLTAMMLLTACSAKTDNPQENSDVTTEQTSSQTSADAVTPVETGSQTTNDNTPSDPATSTSTPETASEKPKEVVPLVTFIELGADSCIPCKMMQPILKELRDEYQGLLKVEFIDLYKDRDAAQKYNVRVMPTQVFLNMDGKEFFRHEGFYPKAEIEKMLLEKIGIRKPEDNVPQTDTTRP